MEKYFDKEFHDLFSSPNITCVVSSRRIRWARHVTRKRAEKCVEYFW